MRTRITGGTLVEHLVHSWYTDANGTQDFGYTPVWGTMEKRSFNDDPVPSALNRFGISAFKECTDIAWSGKIWTTPFRCYWPAWPGDSLYATGAGIVQKYYFWNNPKADMVVHALNHARNTDLQAVDYKHYDRWILCRPSMATRASLSVFLWELKELSSMWNLIPRKHFKTKGFLSPIKDWRAFALDLKTHNGLHLNYNFGWKPFLRDCISVWKGVADFELRLVKFIQNASKALRPRRTTGPTLVDTGTIWYQNLSPDWTLWRKHVAEQQHASAFDFVYEIPPYGEDIVWRSMLDTLGLNLSPQTVYAAVPWSFVVDWFANVGPNLERNNDNWVQPWIDWIQAGYSRKVEGYVKWTVKPTSGSGIVGELPVLELTYKDYMRRLGLPNQTIDPETLNADKIRLGASLILSKLL